MAEAQWVLSTLLQDRRIARATHNMLAYRFWDAERGVQQADRDRGLGLGLGPAHG